MRNIRRKDREITPEKARELLDKAAYGVLSTADRDCQPYGIPLSFVYENNAIYFHCALDGHKLDNIQQNSKVSFCVVGKTEVLPEKFSTRYESAVVFGVAAEVSGAERHNALNWLLDKYCPDFIEEGKKYIQQKDKAVKVIKIEINHITGKARR